MARATVAEREFGGQRAVEVTGDAVRLLLLPDIGAKIVSCLDARSGHEYLWRPRDPGFRYVRPVYGDRFEAYDLSGWDECFPTIGEAAYPEPPWQGVVAPDHGEVWTLPWRVEATAEGVWLATHGVRFPYTFEKRIALADDGFVLSYRVRNPVLFPLKCFWSTHPLLVTTPSTRILLPQGVRMRVEYSMSGRLGPLLTEHPWPRTRDREGRELDLSQFGPPEQREADKLFSTPVPEGWAALHDGESDQWLAFTFDPAQVPLVGVWANRGGWPAERPCYNLALEPCSGCPDRLDIAILRGEYRVVPAEGDLAWRLEVHLGRGREALARLTGVANG